MMEYIKSYLNEKTEMNWVTDHYSDSGLDCVRTAANIGEVIFEFYVEEWKPGNRDKAVVKVIMDDNLILKKIITDLDVALPMMRDILLTLRGV